MAENTLSILTPSVNNLTARMSAVEGALGDAYSEPAADVRGFVASVTSPAG
jgi:hypothetical protein